MKNANFMTFNISDYIEKQKFLEKYRSKALIVAVTKTRPVEDIKSALKAGIRNFGETKVQEAFEKFLSLKADYMDLQLHMIGGLQTNKVKKALEIFNFFHSLDRENLAKEFSKYPEYISNKHFFVQVNTGKEKQKSGVHLNLTSEFIRYCIHDLSLNIVGLMCLPPINDDPKEHFLMLRDLAFRNNLKQLSMGMSSDYKTAIECGATFIRIGSSFFGDRK